MTDRTVSWAELAAETAARLLAAGLPDPERHARLIVERACGAGPGEWLTVRHEPATVRGVDAIDAMTARRLAGEPLQYVIGEWGFRHLDLFVDRRVLIPRPETEVVAGLALSELRRPSAGTDPPLAVDLGTGSGAIGLALATEHDTAELWLTDASADALAVARANLAGVGTTGSRVRLAQGSWFEALPGELRGRIDLVVSNPPYIADAEELPAEVADWEPSSALFAGPTGIEDLTHLVSESPAWLAPTGSLVLELAPHQAATVAALAAGWFREVEVASDLAGRQRAVVARIPLPGATDAPAR